MKTTTAANSTLRNAHPALWRRLSTSDRATAREVLAYCEAVWARGLNNPRVQRAEHPVLGPIWGSGIIRNAAVDDGLPGAWRAYASSEDAARTIIALVGHVAREAGATM